MTVQLSELAGGLRVVTHEMPQLESASIGVWSLSGARHEEIDEHGLAHLIEHMAFKGTRTRSARDIAETIEAVGGDINAATSLENTGFHARMLKQDTETALTILADIVQNPVVNADELAREKSVILQEIGAMRDTPDDLVFELFQETAFSGQILGRSILGTEQSLAGFDASSLDAFRSRNYTRPGLIIAAAGAITHDAFMARADAAFAGLESTPTPTPAPAHYRGGDARADLPLEQVHLVLGFEGVSYAGEDLFAGQILAAILGGGMSSRLFQEVRERRGLCYSIFAFSWSFSDVGVFGVYAAADANSMDELIAVTAGQLHDVATGITTAELNRAKAQARAALVMSLESSSARAEQLARHLQLFGRIVPVSELLQRIDAIEAQAVSALAQRLFSQSAPVVAAAGPVKKLASYETIAAHFNGSRA